MLTILQKDIIKVNVDCIVNSLGIVTTNYGRICYSILKAANSEELNNYIASLNGKASVGDVFITSGYNLCKKIIHVIVPHYEADKDYLSFQATIRNIYVTAYKNNIRKLAIPLIGTGADLYDPAVVFEIITSMAESFFEYYPDMHVYFVLPPKDYKKVEFDNSKNLDSIKEGKVTHRDIELFIHSQSEFTKSDNYYISKNFYYSKEFFEKGIMPETGPLENEKERKTVYLESWQIGKDSPILDYIKAYAHERYPKNAGLEDNVIINVRRYLGYKSKKEFDYFSDTKNGSKKMFKYTIDSIPSRKSFFKIMLGAKMNYEEAVNFFNFYGFSFMDDSIAPEYEKVVVDCIKNYKYNIFQIEQIFKKLNIKDKLF